MRGKALENSAKFFYDCGKVSFAVLVVGVIAHRPFATTDLVWGTALTLLFLIFGIMIDSWGNG